MIIIFTNLVKDGIAGLYVGSLVSVVRGTIGTSANLSTYSYLRDYIITNKIMKDGPVNGIFSCFKIFFYYSLIVRYGMLVYIIICLLCCDESIGCDSNTIVQST